jgi:hypothetical protein
MSNLDQHDAAAEAAHPGAFRITAADIRARVADVEYVERGVLNVAIVRFDNGWWLVGKSAPVNPEAYNAEFGRELALDDALRQAWPLLAFAWLEAQQAPPLRVR